MQRNITLVPPGGFQSNRLMENEFIGKLVNIYHLKNSKNPTDAMTSAWRPEVPLTDGTGGCNDLGQAKHEKSITWCHKSAGGPAIHYRYIPDCA